VTTYYLDSSAIVKRYLVEPGTAWVRTVTDPASGDVTVISEISLVEVAAAFASRYRSGNITIEERDTALRLFLHHADTEYQLVPANRLIVDRAVLLTQQHRLRGYDAAQLATALIVNTQYLAAGLPTLTFAASDTDLLAAAAAAGLTIENPNAHP
jgi:predicted nucleic acid-binding protein